MGPNAQDGAARAKQLVSERKYQDAVRACRRLLLSRPDHVDVRVLLGQALLALGRHDEVRIEMQALLKRSPLVAPAHRLLGEAFLRARQTDNAAASLKEALRLDPEDDDARELLDELGEVDEMPPAETIERWFPEEPTRVEAEAAPAIPAPSAPPPSVELSDDLRDEITRTSEQAAPVRKKTLLGLAAVPPPVQSPAQPPSSTPRASGPLPSPTSPAVVAPPKPSVPPPPPGGSAPTAAPPPSSSGTVTAARPAPARSPKATMIGGFSLPSPGAPSAPRAPGGHASAPIAPAPFAPAPIAPAPARSAPASTTPSATSSPFAPMGSIPSLSSSDLESADSGELMSSEILPASTGDLELEELRTGSSELAASVPLVRPDPYEHLAAEPPPLEGEATDARRPLEEDDLEDDEELPGEPTRGRPPVLDGLSEENDLFVAGLPELEAEPTRARAPVDFEDETTKGRESADVDVATTTKAPRYDDGDQRKTTERPRAAGFPSDAIDDEGLPELAGEATLAKPLPDGPAAPGFAPSAQPGAFAPSARPFSPSASPQGFAPSASPQGFAPSASPQGFAPSASPQGFAPSASPGASGPAGMLPGSTPSSTRTERPSAKTGERTGPVEAVPGGTRIVRVGRWALPLPTAIALAGIPVLVVVLVVLGVRAFLASRAEDAIAAATVAAQRDGMAASLRRALELDADEASDESLAIARRARLYATATLEHGFEERERATSLLSSLDGEGATSQDAHVAGTYLALDAGEIEAATERSMLIDGAALDGEAGHARALLAYTRGELERAENEARAVVALDASAPRHVALLTSILVARGKAPEVLTLLDAITVRSPSVSLARAEALIALQRSADALELLGVMESELGSAVSRRQLAERGRLRLAALIATGRLDDARAQLTQSLAERPVGSELFALELLRAQLTLGDLEGARTLVAALPPQPARAIERGLLSAEVSLASGDLDAVERALGGIGESPRASYLRGRVAEARGRDDEAKGHYQTAAQQASERVRATARLGAIALREEKVRDAIALLEPVLEGASSDAEVVSTLARAYLEADRGDDAARIVTAALAARPDALDLQLAKAEIDLVRGDAAGALATMRAVIERASQSARAQAMLGEAARREGQSALATEAFDRALALDAREPRALIGKVHLAIDAAEPTEAAAALTRAREQGAVDRVLATELEGRVQVMQGLGDQAVRTLRRSALRSRDASLISTFGWALAQAEADRDAIRQFERAVALDPGQVEAWLGLALSRTRRGDLGGASQAIGEAEGLIQRRTLGPRYEARLLAARGRLLYENGSFDDARTKAQEALAKDASCAAAHYVLGLVADARGSSPVEHLRAALAARSPSPEVLGQLLIFDDRAADRCDLARRYLQAAPRGLDARDARSAMRGCR
ncbi:MAG: tetratricopeptide repeat protein [Myxococcota bacterium]|nr:tetratricopeptide repeat protein [Myxococcota bacterium]